MISRWTTNASWFAAAALALAVPGCALAQDGGAPQAEAAASAVVPALIPTSAFAARSPFTGQPQLSPDGKRLAFSLEEDEKVWLGIVDIDRGVLMRKIPLEKDQLLRWFRWAGNDQLMLSLVVPINSLWAEGRVARLFVADLATGQSHYVGPGGGQGLEGDDVLYTDPAGEFVLLSLQPQLYVEPEVWRFRLDGTDTNGEKVAAQRRIIRWIADNAGVVRVGLEVENRKIKVWYRKDPGERLRVIARVRRDDEDDKDEIWDVAQIVAGSDEGLVFEPAESGRLALRRFNYATRELGEVVYENAEWDLSAVELGEDGQPEAVQFTDDQDRVFWFDPELERLQSRLQRTLGPNASIVDRARDGSRLLVSTEGASDPGTWYVYTAATRDLKEFVQIRPGIDPAMLAEVRPVTYTARDGTSIRAYLTLPKGREARGLPLIILPHGGPYGVRDKLSYSDEVQLLANRGYAVLQPNYRGSGGFGEAFEEQGKGEIGRKMQDDLDDAMDWAVGEGIADPERVCLVGSSYGGYAALWGVIRNPERYRCAASFAGVTEWDKMLSYNRNFLSRQGRRKLRDLIQGEERTFDLDSVSPARRARALTRPVLLAHGRKDSTVPFTQFRDMRNALQDAGARHVQYLDLEEAGHGFSRSEDEQAWYDALLGFLARHNPADAPSVGAGG
jgi:dipeptidyl aminopeptidase/acylaminoacyl peptidase